MSLKRPFEIGLFTFGEITADPVTGRPIDPAFGSASSSTSPARRPGRARRVRRRRAPPPRLRDCITARRARRHRPSHRADPAHQHRSGDRAVHRRPGQGVRGLHRRRPHLRRPSRDHRRARRLHRIVPTVRTRPRRLRRPVRGEARPAPATQPHEHVTWTAAGPPTCRRRHLPAARAGARNSGVDRRRRHPGQRRRGRHGSRSTWPSSANPNASPRSPTSTATAHRRAHTRHAPSRGHEPLLRRAHLTGRPRTSTRTTRATSATCRQIAGRRGQLLPATPSTPGPAHVALPCSPAVRKRSSTRSCGNTNSRPRPLPRPDRPRRSPLRRHRPLHRTARHRSAPRHPTRTATPPLHQTR